MNTCGKCEQELSTKIPFCPFCGTAQDLKLAQSTAQKNKQNASERKPMKKLLLNDHELEVLIELFNWIERKGKSKSKVATIKSIRLRLQTNASSKR